MKRNKSILLNIFCLVCISLIYTSCGEYEVPVEYMTPIDIGGVPEAYASLNENEIIQIPIKFTTPCDSGLMSANYQVVNNRVSNTSVVSGPKISIPINGKSVNTTINVPVRCGMMGVVISIYDKTGKMSCKTINVKKVVPSNENVKTLTDVVMSTDPADNQCFFSLYETNPVFGVATGLTKQDRIDFILANMSGAKPISCHAYSASSSYYSAAKPYLLGFTTLTYSFISSSKSYITKEAFDAIVKEADLKKFLDSTVIGPAPVGAKYNLINADRRVGDAFSAVGTNINKGFIIGWGYHTSPVVTTTSVLNESFALVMVKTVTKKTNGHYIITFDVKAPVADQRASYNASSIVPYDPYPL